MQSDHTLDWRGCTCVALAHPISLGAALQRALARCQRAGGGGGEEPIEDDGFDAAVAEMTEHGRARAASHRALELERGAPEQPAQSPLIIDVVDSMPTLRNLAQERARWYASRGFELLSAKAVGQEDAEAAARW